jgi:predicted DNA-binding transcriptional regulator YafY
LMAAHQTGVKCRLVYDAADGSRREKTVEVHSLFTSKKGDVLVYCLPPHGAIRSWRLDRIKSIQILPGYVQDAVCPNV